MTDTLWVVVGGLVGALAIRYGSVHWLRMSLLPGLHADRNRCASDIRGEIRGAIRVLAETRRHT